jgi:hypothetical protein
MKAIVKSVYVNISVVRLTEGHASSELLFSFAEKNQFLVCANDASLLRSTHKGKNSSSN